MSFENINVSLDENTQIENVFYASNSNEVAILATSEVVYLGNVLRLYRLQLNHESEMYDPLNELAAFSFLSQQELIDFLEKIPNMTAFEILMIMENQESHDVLN